MPFKSKAQRRKFYVLARQGKISISTVKEWERETKNKNLPEHVKKKKKKTKKRQKKANVTVGDVLNFIRRYAYANPLIATGTNSLLGLLVGRYLLGSTLARMSGVSRRDPERAKKIKNIGSLLGLASGLMTSYPWLKFNVENKGLKGLWSSYPFDESIVKESSLSTRGTLPAIGVPYVRDLLDNDPYLTTSQRFQAKQLFDMAAQKAQTKTGLISIGDIARAAIGAGLGAGTAYVGAHTLGKFFGLSNDAKRKMTRLGLLGGLLLNSGLIG